MQMSNSLQDYVANRRPFGKNGSGQPVNRLKIFSHGFAGSQAAARKFILPTFTKIRSKNF